MELKVAPEVWERLGRMRLVVVTAAGLENGTPRPAVETELSKVESELRRAWGYPNPQSHPRLAAWRDVFRCLGVSRKRHQSSVEALVRRVLGGRNLPRINPLVDLYNMLSLRHRVPAGGLDLDALRGDLVLGFTRGGEPFRELGSEETVAVAEGELAYADDQGILTRHFVWRQSERAKVSPSTRRVLLVSEVLEAVEVGVEDAVATDLVGGLWRHFGVEAPSAILTAGTVAWPLR
jgi:DNA/RNA-binding domain of Phe-tRNA-synthetase-like protein